jgi:ribonuclease HI
MFSNATATIMPNAHTTRMRSDAFVTREDMAALNRHSVPGSRRKVPLPDLPHATATRFEPNDGTPEDYYYHDADEIIYRLRPGPFDRMVSRSAPWDDILIYTDGACPGQHISGDAAKHMAGCAVIYKPSPGRDYLDDPEKRGFALQLEDCGPTGELYTPTSNGAELRAAIAALECRRWNEEGWIRVTVATDSAYVVKGITNWIGTWMRNGWRTSAGKPVLNRDLWEKLLSQVNLHAHWGCKVRFWWIPRAQNECADALARYAAEHLDFSDSYTPIKIGTN